MNSEYFFHLVDPGGDTGMALLHVRRDGYELLDRATVPYDPERTEPPTRTLARWLHAYPGVHRLLYENFHIRNIASAAGTDTTALRVIGGIEEMLHVTPGYPYLEVVKYEPVQAKFLATDEVLERLDLHLGHRHAQRHVRDALRHGVSYLVDSRYLPMCRAAFPPGTITTRRPR